MAEGRVRRAGRWAVIGVVVLLGVTTFLFLRGPAAWQRRYYPLQHRSAIEDAAMRHRSTRT